MDFRDQFRCKRSTCEGKFAIPIKILLRGNVVVVLARCHLCRKKYKINLSASDRDQWIPFVRELFQLCEVCGQPLSPSWRPVGISFGMSLKLHDYRNIKLANPCLSCKRNGMKVINELIWSFMYPTEQSRQRFSSSPVAAPAASPISSKSPSEASSHVAKPARFCSQCGSAVEPDALFCANCGSQLS
ncbi:MAG: zinc-ribbon domain-containing protein [Candidatus Helarchaeota archaeon]